MKKTNEIAISDSNFNFKNIFLDTIEFYMVSDII